MSNDRTERYDSALSKPTRRRTAAVTASLLVAGAVLLGAVLLRERERAPVVDPASAREEQVHDVEDLLDAAFGDSDRAARGALLELIASETTPALARQRAILGLRRMASLDVATVDALRRIIERGDVYDRRSRFLAIDCLRRGGPVAKVVAPNMISTMRDQGAPKDVRQLAAKALVALDSNSAATADALCGALMEDDLPIREAAAVALRWIGPDHRRRAIECLREASAHADGDLRSFADESMRLLSEEK